MKMNLSSNTLQEDLNALGVKGLTEDAMAAVALGTPMSEKVCASEEEPDEEMGDEEMGDEEDGEDYEESKHDPFDGPYVTNALFDRIMALPYESLTAEDVQEVIEALKVKRIPRNVVGLAERAEDVARHLISEMRGKRVRKFKAGSMSKRTTYQCPPGYRKGPGGKGCVRAAVAVGGAGKLAKIARKSKLRAKSGLGKKSAKKSERWAARRGGNESFAVELEHLLSEHEDRALDVRAEILGRIDSIVEMITWEFDDEAVMAVFNEAIEPLAASYEAGRLDEDVMSVDAFLAEIRPVMSLISKSLDRLDRGDLGN